MRLGFFLWGFQVAGLAELAIAAIRTSQDRIEVIANNVVNLNTPGFRGRRVFQHVLDARAPANRDFVLPDAVPETRVALSARSGATPLLRDTGRSLDLAVTGDAWLLLREGDRLIPMSSAQLHRDANSRLVDDRGRALQGAGGGDIVVSSDGPSILPDGTILVGGQPEGRIGLFASDGSDAESLNLQGGSIGDEFPDVSDDAILRQGAIIPSNVDLGAEMIALTEASRMAESGARMFRVYDDLLGSVASKLGSLS